MSEGEYLLDTHALIFWRHRTEISQLFLQYLDYQAKEGNLFVSSIAFWETALLVQKGRIAIEDIQTWKDEILTHSSVRLIEPTAGEMIASTQLPAHHKDPFDRLLIAQAQQRQLVLVTRDAKFDLYDIDKYWAT